MSIAEPTTEPGFPPLTVKRNPRAQTIARWLTVAALSALVTFDPVPTRSQFYIGDAKARGRRSFKANRRLELKARARKRGLRY